MALGLDEDDGNNSTDIDAASGRSIGAAMLIEPVIDEYDRDAPSAAGVGPAPIGEAVEGQGHQRTARDRSGHSMNGEPPACAPMGDLPILYSFRRCPYAIRARLALLASRTLCIVREVKLSAKPAAMLLASPKGTVPVLVLPRGEVIEQSIDIMRWALARNDPGGWLGQGGDHLIETNDGPFKHHLDRAKYPDRYGCDADTHRAACLDLLRPIEERLAAAPYLCGAAMSLADAAILPFIRQFAMIDRDGFDAQPLPHTRRWLDSGVGSPLFDQAMARLTPWQDGDAPIFQVAGVGMVDDPQIACNPAPETQTVR